MTTKNKPYYAIQLLGETRKAEIYIFGDIIPGADTWDGEVDAKSIVDRISYLDVDQITVYINCYGGSIAEAWAIKNALEAHNAKIVTVNMGFVASAAIYPFMAGEERYTCRESAFYFHQGMLDGDNTDPGAQTLTEIGLHAITDKANLSDEEMLEIMKAETWMKPDDALEKGIATAIISNGSVTGASQSIKESILQALTSCPAQPSETPPITPPAEPAPEDIEKTETSIMQMLAGLNFLQ